MKSKLNWSILIVTAYKDGEALTSWGWSLAWLSINLSAHQKKVVLVWPDVAFLGDIVNPPSDHAPQNYNMLFLSFVGTEIYQMLEMLELVVQVDIWEVEYIKKNSWPKMAPIWALQRSSQLSGTTIVWGMWWKDLHTF